MNVQEVSTVKNKGVWVNRIHYSSYAAYRKATAKKIASNYLRKIPSPIKSKPSSPTPNIFQRALGSVTGGISAITTRISNIERKLATINITQILSDIKAIFTRITTIESKIAYYATHLQQLKQLLQVKLSELERHVYGAIKSDIHTIDNDISKAATDLHKELLKGETALNIIIKKVLLYAEKVYSTARKDITGVERRLKLLLEKDKKYIIDFLKLYLEAMFPWLFLKHILSDKLIKIFAWWILHVIEKILFEI